MTGLPDRESLITPVSSRIFNAKKAVRNRTEIITRGDATPSPSLENRKLKPKML